MLIKIKRIFVGITGASGSIYGLRLIKVLSSLNFEVEVCFSEAGIKVTRYETDLRIGEGKDKIKEELTSYLSIPDDRVEVFLEDDFFAPAASGSNLYRAIFIAPCSMSTLSHVAYGTGRNLIHRAAEVALKQGYPLILLPRETPVSLVHLRAMVSVAEAGAKIVLPSPAFYHRPQSVEALVDFVIGKMLDAAGIENNLFKRWQSQTPKKP